MATRNFVPRQTEEGGIGTSLKRWLNGFFSVLDIKTRLKFGLVDGTTESHEEGKVYYDQVAKTLTLHNEDSQVRHNLGQENIVRVKNISGSLIPNGSVLKITGADVDGVPTVDLAQANTLPNSNLLGISTTDITDQTFGYATLIGFVNNVDTSSFLVGDKLYLSESVLGGLSATPSPIEIFIGYVLISDATNGRLFVNTGFPINATGDMLKSIYDTNSDGIVEKSLSQSHEYAESDAESSTTSATLQDKTTLTFTPATTGDYILEWSFEVSNNTNSGNTRIVVLQDATTLSDTNYTSSNTYSEFQQRSGFTKVSLTGSQSYTFKIQFSLVAGGIAYIKNARIIARRVH